MNYNEEIKFYSKAIPALMDQIIFIRKHFIDYLNGTEESLQILFDEIQDLKRRIEENK